jgi:fructokinase
MFAGIETGGTKTVCAVGAGGVLEARAQFATGSDPEALISRCAEFFAQFTVDSLGLASFGPIDTDRRSATYGHVTTTPKPGWAGIDVLGLLCSLMPGVAVAMTLDVAAAALGELHYGAGRGVDSMVYLTIGTGIGAGVIMDGSLVSGRQHPEAGHMLLPSADFPGVCPYHGDCFEGVASGPALAARTGVTPIDLADDHPVWATHAAVVAAGLHNLTVTYRPQRIVVGGGVGSRAVLHERVVPLLRASLDGYVPVPEVLLPALGADAGVTGAIRLAMDHSQG